MFSTSIRRWFLLFLGLLFSQIVYAQNNAEFVSQDVPNRLEQGKTYTASVTFKNTGSTTWTAAGGYNLVSTTPTQWTSDGWVRLAAGDSVAPQQSKTFVFTITAPANTTGSRAFHSFSFKMLKEGVEWFGPQSSPMGMEVFYAPALTTTRPPLYPRVVLPANDSRFSFNAFRGANVLQNTGQAAPTESEMVAISNAAINMKLNYIRYHLVIPGDNETANLNKTLAETQIVLDTAYKHGLKTLLVLVGYSGLNTSCDYRLSLNAKRSNATTLIRAFANHPSVFAWDLSNEPLWETSAKDCLNAGAGLSAEARYQDVIDGVHEMYNIVRANDPTNKPTTVGEYPAPFLKYWNDISSFAAPHFYVELDPAAPDLAKLASVVGNTIEQYKTETAGRPLILGEFGFELGVMAANETARANAYQTFYAVAQQKNIGSMFWLLSTGASQQPWSILNTDASWKPAAAVVATQVSETRNAAFVSQSVPTVMNRGMLYNVNITLNNTGTATWSQAQYKLAAVDPAVETAFGVARVTLSSAPIEAIFAGQSKSFNFTVRAPSTPGSYNFHYQMLREGVATFGPVTPNVVVTVQ